jgi:beta-xylosidase
MIYNLNNVRFKDEGGRSIMIYKSANFQHIMTSMEMLTLTMFLDETFPLNGKMSM